MDQETLILLQALTSDDAKTARLNEIMAAQKQLDASKAAADLSVEQAAELRNQAIAIRTETRQTAEAAEQRKAQLDERENAMAGVAAALDTEKQAFAQVRDTATAQMEERERVLAGNEEAVKAREDAVAKREAAAGEMEKALAVRAAHLFRMTKRLRDALADNEADTE